MVKNILIGLLAGGVIGYLGKSLGPFILIISALTASTLLIRPLITKFFKGDARATSFFIFLLLFEIAGFTCVAYSSIPEAVSFYGDFHDLKIYKNITTKSIIETAPFIILPIESKIAAFLTQTENDEAILIFIGLINRILALFLLFLVGRELSRSDTIALLGTYAFVFSYRLIPFTQGMKFVVGMPFLLAWIFLTIKQEKTGKSFIFLQAISFLFATLSEQWTASFIVITCIIYTALKIFFQKKIFLSEALASICITIASVVWYFIERARFERDEPFFLRAYPPLSLPYVDTLPFLTTAFLITICTTTVFAWHIFHKKQKGDFKEIATRWLLVSLIIISAIYGMLGSDSMQSYITSMQPMLLFDAFFAMLMGISTPIALAGFLAMTAHYVMPYAGIIIMQSPYPAAIAAPFALFSLSEKKSFLWIAWVLATASGALFIWQFIEYTHGLKIAQYIFPWIIILIFLSHYASTRKKSHAI